MKKLTKMSLPLIAVITVMLSCSKEKEQEKLANNTSDVNTVAAAADSLLWSDEFNGTAVDLTKWTFDPGAGQNNEQQYYQAANASVTNGNLVISAKKESAGGRIYTSSRLNTSGKFNIQFGRIEARIKIPVGQGMWPAFWALGQNFSTVGWPKCGEIDIMEHVNTDNIFYGTIHWDNNGHAQYGNQTTSTTADYHIFAVEWDATSIRWYVDNILYNTADIKNNVNGTEEFHKPFFLILNLAVGGDWPGTTIDETKLPANLLVDYVRVYKLTVPKK